MNIIHIPLFNKKILLHKFKANILLLQTIRKLQKL